jgi:antitoxin (DNA-binding transcriptional repressor) of toxin-antitoxin stability system
MQGRRKGLREDAAAFDPDHPGQLREVQASEAKTHLPRLLDEVERGATIVITRHGRCIAPGSGGTAPAAGERRRARQHREVGEGDPRQTRRDDD